MKTTPFALKTLQFVLSWKDTRVANTGDSGWQGSVRAARRGSVLPPQRSGDPQGGTWPRAPPRGAQLGGRQWACDPVLLGGRGVGYSPGVESLGRGEVHFQGWWVNSLSKRPCTVPPAA